MRPNARFRVFRERCDTVGYMKLLGDFDIATPKRQGFGEDVIGFEGEGPCQEPDAIWCEKVPP